MDIQLNKVQKNWASLTENIVLAGLVVDSEICLMKKEKGGGSRNISSATWAEEKKKEEQFLLVKLSRDEVPC